MIKGVVQIEQPLLKNIKYIGKLGLKKIRIMIKYKYKAYQEKRRELALRSSATCL